MHNLACNPSALHVDDLFYNPNVLQMQTHPTIPDISQTWYCAKDVVLLLGQTWNGAPRNLKKIPAHHKAILGYMGIKGPVEVWCISKTGVSLLHKQVTGYDPIGLHGLLCAEPQGVASETTDIAVEYAELLASARSIPTPLSLMLLLDALTRPAIECIRAFLHQPAPTIRYRAAKQVLDLRAKLSLDEKEQFDAYIGCLIDEDEALA